MDMDIFKGVQWGGNFQKRDVGLGHVDMLLCRWAPVGGLTSRGGEGGCGKKITAWAQTPGSSPGRF